VLEFQSVERLKNEAYRYIILFNSAKGEKINIIVNLIHLVHTIKYIFIEMTGRFFIVLYFHCFYNKYWNIFIKHYHNHLMLVLMYKKIF